MKMTVRMAGTNITLNFADRIKMIKPFCDYFFKGFTHTDLKGTVEVRLGALSDTAKGFPGGALIPNQPPERLVRPGEVKTWLNKSPGYTGDFQVNETTICSVSSGGLLLFDTETSDGRIYFFKSAQENFHFLHRLLWIYFAQVLGEKGGCFLHAAGLANGKKGALFLGDSGAGKSTIAGLCPECRVLSDDGPIFFEHNGEYMIYPSPYYQIDRLKGLNKEIIQMSARVKNLYFLVKDRRPFLKEVLKKDAFSMILNRHIHFFTFLSAQAKTALFDLFFRVCDIIPIYNLHFTKEPGIWGIISEKPCR
ncbi:MAG: hypothetical protein GY864_00435 [Desulfobacterales bacterium]|nr:hypothetical protein [Desulfobacterales bacterium]